MTRSEFISRNPILSALESRGVKVTGGGNSRMACCPFHGDKTPSMSVKVDDGTWYCHPCKMGGGVIDLLAKLENISPVDFLRSPATITALRYLPRPSSQPSKSSTSTTTRWAVTCSKSCV
jgi:DNA primase